MVYINFDGQVFEPVIPRIHILKIKHVDELKELAKVIKDNPELFPNLTYADKQDIAYRNGAVTARPNGDSGEPRIIAKKGDYLLTSENYYRHITDLVAVTFGDFDDVPRELFIPREGRRL